MDKRVVEWVHAIGTLIGLAAIAYYAGQISRDLELLRTDFSGHEMQWLQWLMSHAQ